MDVLRSWGQGKSVKSRFFVVFYVKNHFSLCFTLKVTFAVLYTENHFCRTFKLKAHFVYFDVNNNF